MVVPAQNPDVCVLPVQWLTQTVTFSGINHELARHSIVSKPSEKFSRLSWRYQRIGLTPKHQGRRLYLVDLKHGRKAPVGFWMIVGPGQEVCFRIPDWHRSHSHQTKPVGDSRSNN